MLRWVLAACCLLLPQESLRDLDSPDPAVARRAFEAAIRAGDEKALEAAAKTSERARLALAEVRAHRRFGDAYPQVRTFTFSIKDLPFDQALVEFGKSLGVRVEEPHKLPPGVMKDLPERVTLDLTDAYFLEALELFAAASKSHLWLDGKGIRCSRFTAPASPKQFGRTFALSAESLNEQRTITPFGVTNSTTLEIRCSFDGTARLSGVRKIRVVEARDDANRDVATEAQESPWRTQDFLPGVSYPFAFPLKGLSPEAKHLSVFKGVIEFLVPDERQFAELKLEAAAKEMTIEGVQVTAELTAAGHVQVTCAVLQPDKPHIRPRPCDLRLESAAGALAEPEIVSTGPPNAPVQSWKLIPPAGFKAAVLRFQNFKSVGEYSVPFEFKNLKIR
jgi:hypothetical protein